VIIGDYEARRVDLEHGETLVPGLGRQEADVRESGSAAEARSRFGHIVDKEGVAHGYVDVVGGETRTLAASTAAPEAPTKTAVWRVRRFQLLTACAPTRSTGSDARYTAVARQDRADPPLWGRRRACRGWIRGRLSARLLAERLGCSVGDDVSTQRRCSGEILRPTTMIG
jgi:hypothetical protein